MIIKPESIKMDLSIEKLHKYGISYDEFFAELTPEQQRYVENEAKYYILRMELRQQRKAQGLTQQQLAEKAHLPRTMITKIESGSRNVTVSTLMSIAEAIGKKLVIGLK